MAIPRPKMYWPLVVDATNNKIPVKIGAGADQSATIASATYLSAETYRAAVQTALAALSGGGAFTATIDLTTGQMTISLGSAFVLRFGAFPANAAYAAMGWFAVDTASSATQLAPNQTSNGWWSPVAVFSDGLPERDRSMDMVTVAVSGQSKWITEVELAKRVLEFQFLPPTHTYINKEGAVLNRAIERLWQDGRVRFRYWPDATVEGTNADYFLDAETGQAFAPKRQFQQKELYQMTLRLRGYVP